MRKSFCLFVFGQQVHATQTGNGVDAKLIESTLKYLLLFYVSLVSDSKGDDDGRVS